MRQLVVIVCTLVSVLVLNEAAWPRRYEMYTTKYDNNNIDENFASDRLIDSYVKCLMDKGRCSPEGAELKCKF